MSILFVFSNKPTSAQIHPTTTHESTSVTTEPTLERLPEPINGYIFDSPHTECVAPLEINTVGNGGYYFVLKGYSNPTESLKFFIDAGDSVEVLVPLGYFEVYYAHGEYWYGENDLFGPDTVYQKCDKIFQFTKEKDEYVGWTIDLYPVTNGNFDSDYINKEDFPK